MGKELLKLQVEQELPCPKELQSSGRDAQHTKYTDNLIMM